MKKIKFKKWVETTLEIINFLAILVFASDSNSTITFIIVHLLALAVFLMNTYLLYTFTDMFKEE